MSLFAGESLATISDVISFKWKVWQQQTILLFSEEVFDDDKWCHCFLMRYVSNNKWCHCLQVKIRQQQEVMSLVLGENCDNDKRCHCFQVKCHSTTRVLCFFSGEVLCNETDSLPMTDEQRLYRRLRMNYDPFTRPVYNASQPVVVKIGITLTQIFDLVSVIVSEHRCR